MDRTSVDKVMGQVEARASMGCLWVDGIMASITAEQRTISAANPVDMEEVQEVATLISIKTFLTVVEETST